LTSPILSIKEASDGQTNQFATLNEAIRALEAAGNDFYSVSLASGDFAITNATPDFIFSRYFLFKTTGNTVARVLTVPQAKRFFGVYNGGTFSLKVKRGTAEISVPAGSAYLFYGDATTNGLFSIGGTGSGGSSNTVATASSVAGVLDLSAVTAETIKVTLTQNITSITYPSGTAGVRRDLMIRFVQDSTGGWTVDLTGINWDAGGTPPTIDPAIASITYITASNVDNSGWEGFQ